MKKSEYTKFDQTMRRILNVSHSEIKNKIDEENEAKKQKKAKKSSASRVAGVKD